MTPKTALQTGLLLAATAAAAGLVFALWVENGPQMVNALIQAGLAWCF